MSAPAVSFGTDDRSHRARLKDLLSDGAWHTQGEMRDAAGWRYSSRLSELRATGLRIETRRTGPGLFEFRQIGFDENQVPRRSWKQRAIEAEARAVALELRLHALEQNRREP